MRPSVKKYDFSRRSGVVRVEAGYLSQADILHKAIQNFGDLGGKVASIAVFEDPIIAIAIIERPSSTPDSSRFFGTSNQRFQIILRSMSNMAEPDSHIITYSIRSLQKSKPFSFLWNRREKNSDSALMRLQDKLVRIIDIANHVEPEASLQR